MPYLVDYATDADPERPIREDFTDDLAGARREARYRSRKHGTAYVIRYSGWRSGPPGDYVEHGQAVYCWGGWSHDDDDFREPT